MSIKLIATDLDGTFLNSNHVTIPQENIEAFKKAHDMGIKVVIASGRTKILTDYLVEQLPFLDYLITSNGACVYDLKMGKMVASTTLDNKQSLAVFDVLSDYELPAEIYFEGDCYMDDKAFRVFNSGVIAPHIFDLMKNFLKVVPSLSELIGSKGIEKVNIMSLTNKERTEIEEKLANVGDFSFASSFPQDECSDGNLEITHINSNKGYAVKCLAESLGLESQNVMCFGDGENDCTMLEFADYSFAMANGSDYAKSSAKFVADTNDNGGVAKAIKQYVFGE